jgi:hypothetical protein
MIADERTGRLLRCGLANAAALGLDDTQVAALARLHWGGAPPGGIVAAMLAVMSESQFCETVARLTEVPEQQVPLDTKAIESAVAAAVDKRSKDRSLVETELATAAAEKMLGWAKLFATFVAVPVGVLLLILTFFGISKFEDITRVSNQADTLVTEARTKLAEGTAQFDSIKTKIDGLTGQLDNTRSNLERQLTDVKQFTTKNEDNITKLVGNVDNLQNSVTNLQSASTSLLLGASGKSVVELQSRLKELGFFQGEPNGILGPSTVEAVKAFQKKNGLNADGIVGAQMRALLFKS